MRQINLLPPELAAKRRSRRMAGVLAVVGAGLAGLLVIVYGAQQARLSGEKGKLKDRQEANLALQRQVATLQRFQQQQDDLVQRQALLTALSKNEILWSGVLTDVSLVIPPDDWITNFTGSTTVAAGIASGSVQVAGCTLIPPDGDHLNVAQFLVQIAKPLTFADDPFLTISSVASRTGPNECPVQFNAQIQLTEAAKRSANKDRERKV